MSNFVKIKARAKINIILDVIGKRNDGYHELQTIMQTLNLHDLLIIRKLKEDKITIITDSKKIPSNNANLAYKAAECLKKNYYIRDGIEIKIHKVIPVAAGLAGGSSDCAAALKGIRKLFKLSISNEKLSKIGASIGADVPYCLKGGTYLAEGIGEKLTKLTPFPVVYVLLVKPAVSVSTAWVYKNFNISNVENVPNIKKMIEYISYCNINEISKNLRNALESVTIPKYPIINQIKETMLKSGAKGALMSGSGPTVFGLYESRAQCQNALNIVRAKFRTSECFITSISNNY